jgi:hypothetical protein
MTYRERIQSLTNILEDAYSDSEYLRDCAAGNEKDYWNRYRGELMSVIKILYQLDRKLPPARAEMEV